MPKLLKTSLIAAVFSAVSFCGAFAPVFAASHTPRATPGHSAHVHGAANAEAHHEAAHEEHHDGPGHVLTWVALLAKATAPSPLSDFLTKWEAAIFTAIIVSLISLFMILATRNLKIIPGRGQSALEMLITTLDDVVIGVIGSRGRHYTPFLGSLFIYIMISNLFGLIPLQNSTTAMLTTVVPIALCVFFYVQWTGITRLGIFGYLHHLCGSPQDIFGWLVAPLMFPLHVLGEFIKPLSLSFRLYGNVMAGHVLLAVFMGLGISISKHFNIPFFGFPIHFPFLFLEILVGVIQAFVFTLLSTVYIAMMLPHEHEEHGHHAAEASHH